MASITLRCLEEYLQELETFEKPKILLEQYSTSAHIAARMLYYAQEQFDEIQGRAVADLGCGCGHLSIGAKMLEASHVTGFEIDSDALDILFRNCNDLELYVETVQCDILQYLPGRFEKFFDTVIMNPPFGTKHNTGIDMKFLEIATKLASNSVYSLHKTSTRNYVLRKAAQYGAKGKVVAEVKFDIPRSYKFHKQCSVDIETDLIRFELN
ncbi:rRNA N6-adenosine-methyltransferase Mettl5 [Bombus pascuorum]|uniref:rRNA N6-adenosine-methyltransferase Mettl5 n=1 Tax=Bombus pascuorum TaxID=65598 RepID=UPI002121C907|nr:rRNA N6-adenosine-methyltransferase Mettl5 [Bombus pascuorum]